MLEIENLSKKYGNFWALRDFSASFESGIYGILGSNGAGKSTLLNLLTDNLKRSGGSIRYEGKEILQLGRSYRSAIGYMPQQQGFYEQFSAMEFLRYIGELKGLRGKSLSGQAMELLRQVNMYEHRNEALSTFSGGMRQRVLLAQALLGNPRIIILDEPTAGLDPKERIHMRNLIAELSADRIIFLATHVVSDIECIANEVLLMKKGSLLTKDTPSNLIASIDGKVGEILCTKEQLSDLQSCYPTGNTIQRKNGLFFRVVGDVLPPEADRVEEDLTLEDVFLYYMHRTSEE